MNPQVSEGLLCVKYCGGIRDTRGMAPGPEKAEGEDKQCGEWLLTFVSSVPSGAHCWALCRELRSAQHKGYSLFIY